MNQAIPRIVVLVLAVMLAGCEKHEGTTEKPDRSTAKVEHHDEVKLSAEAIQKYGIKVEPVKRHKLTPTVIAPARVSFNAEAIAHVGTPLRGRVVELKVRKGDDVKKGEALVLVESPELGEAQSEFLQKSAALTSARPGVEFARSAYERARSLYEGTKGISLGELQKREAELAVGQGSLQAAEAAMNAASNRLRLLGMDQHAIEEVQKTKQIQPRFAIIAPIAGRVIEREMTLGELVSTEKEALLVVADINTLWVLADVPEARITEIGIGAPARIKLAANSAAIQGKVSFIDTALDPHTRSARVRIVIDNTAGAIRPGMFAQAEIVCSPAENGQPILAIPDEAVQLIEGATAVFIPVKGEDNTFTKRKVTVGRAVGGMVPVLSGLKEGEPVVIQGGFLLKIEMGKGEDEHDH